MPPKINPQTQNLFIYLPTSYVVITTYVLRSLNYVYVPNLIKSSSINIGWYRWANRQECDLYEFRFTLALNRTLKTKIFTLGKANLGYFTSSLDLDQHCWWVSDNVRLYLYGNETVFCDTNTRTLKRSLHKSLLIYLTRHTQNVSLKDVEIFMNTRKASPKKMALIRVRKRYDLNVKWLHEVWLHVSPSLVINSGGGTLRDLKAE